MMLILVSNERNQVIKENSEKIVFCFVRKKLTSSVCLNNLTHILTMDIRRIYFVFHQWNDFGSVGGFRSQGVSENQKG